MSFLEGLHRERYLVLRALRLAQHRLRQLAPEDGPAPDRLGELLAFLDDFALRHFLAREILLLEVWERHHPDRGRVLELSTLRQGRFLVEGLVRSLEGHLRAEAADPVRVRGDLCRLISHLSRTLVRGERAVSNLERGLEEAGEGLRRTLADSLPTDEDVEQRFVAVIQVLEGREVTEDGGGDGGEG